jgi:hypothetical protein
MVAELGDLTRFDNPRPLMKFLGLLPSESSTGERRRQGSITNAGKTPARRVLVEGAWAYRYPANVRRHVHLRLEQPPKAIQDLSWKAHVRLCKRYRRLMARGKHANQVVVAMARELMGCLWAIAKQVRLTPESHHIEGECTKSAAGFRRPFEEAQPRCGAILDGVKRLKETRVPRARQAPDGCTSGGRQPTDSSRINRRIYWLRLFPCTTEKKHHADLKPLCPTLDIGSHINAGPELLPEAGARDERTLEAVSSRPLFGRVVPQDTSVGTGSLACRVRYASTSSCMRTTSAR